MIRVDPFEPFDLAEIAVQVAQAELSRDVLAHGRGLAASGRAFTIRSHVGARPIFCGGTIETHPHLATLWSVVATDAGPHLTAITRRVRQFIAGLGQTRVDAMVRAGFSPGARWVTLLGLVPEARLWAYFENGDDAMIYRLVR